MCAREGSILLGCSSQASEQGRDNGGDNRADNCRSNPRDRERKTQRVGNSACHHETNAIRHQSKESESEDVQGEGKD